jgi:hypothetical protein
MLVLIYVEPLPRHFCIIAHEYIKTSYIALHIDRHIHYGLLQYEAR